MGRDVIVYGTPGERFVKCGDKKLYLETKDQNEKLGYKSVSEQELYVIYAEADKVETRRAELFETLYQDRTITLLTQIFKRNVKNSARNLSIEGVFNDEKLSKKTNTIQIDTRLKTITINRKGDFDYEAAKKEYEEWLKKNNN